MLGDFIIVVEGKKLQMSETALAVFQKLTSASFWSSKKDRYLFWKVFTQYFSPSNLKSVREMPDKLDGYAWQNKTRRKKSDSEIAEGVAG